MKIIARAALALKPFWRPRPLLVAEAASTPVASSADPQIGDALVARCIWSAWFLLTLLAVGYVVHYGRNCPYFDDFYLVPALTHDQPITLRWLWQPHNEHRIPGCLHHSLTAASARRRWLR